MVTVYRALPATLIGLRSTVRLAWLSLAEAALAAGVPAAALACHCWASSVITAPLAPPRYRKWLAPVRTE